MNMDTAPTDGTRILVQTEVWSYVRLYDRPNSFKGWKRTGEKWLECRYHDGQWREWCGDPYTQSTEVIRPIQWRELP